MLKLFLYSIVFFLSVFASELLAQSACDSLSIPRGGMYPPERRELCQDDTLLLQGMSLSGVYQGQWFRNGLPLQGENNDVLIVWESGVYSYRLKLDTCYSASFDTVLIRFRNQPRPRRRFLSADSLPSIAGKSFKLRIQNLGNPATISYSWYRSSILESGTADSLVSGNPGRYRVRTDSAGCHSFSNTIYINPPGAYKPAICAVSPLEPNGLRVEWVPTPASIVIQYRIYRKRYLESAFSRLDTAEPEAGYWQSSSEQVLSAYDVMMTARVEGPNPGSFYETEPSSVTRSIFLRVDGTQTGFPDCNTLRWNSYEGAYIPRYYIYRNGQLRDSVDGSYTQYQDCNPPASAIYRVEAAGTETCPGLIGSLLCDSVSGTGTLIKDSIAINVTSIIPYRDATGGDFPAISIPSTGISGLFATLQSGSLENGNGTLNLMISGKPTANGMAEFSISIGGKSCLIRKIVVANGKGVSDIDGNQYGSLIIGAQEWMSENLKVNRYRNGDQIPSNLDGSSWSFTTSGASAVYDNLPENNIQYGKLYNWYAVADSRGLCPAGWHVPTDHDWQILTRYVDLAADTNDCCNNLAGGKLKSAGTIESGTGIWSSPNSGATNETGFSAFPGGYRFADGTFIQKGLVGYWWTSTSHVTPNGWSRPIEAGSAKIFRYSNDKNYGFSVRCLKDMANFSSGINGYSFTNSLGTYTPVSGGTTVGNPGFQHAVFGLDSINPLTEATGTGSYYGNAGFGAPIGFDFKFGSRTYTSFQLSTDGYIKLGGIVPADPYSTIITGTSLPFQFANSAEDGRDLISAFGSNNAGGLGAQTGSTMKYITTGSVPNRVCTIEWAGVCRLGVVGDNFNFQIKLYETSNKFEIVYGNMVTAAASTISASAGAVGRSNSDFKKVGNTLTANTMENPVVSTTNIVSPFTNERIQWRNGFMPSIGRTYTFGPADTAEYCNMPVKPVFTRAGTIVNISWTHSGAAMYNVEYRDITAGSLWQSVPGGTNTSLTQISISGLDTAHAYEFRIQSYCSGNDWIYSTKIATNPLVSNLLCDSVISSPGSLIKNLPVSGMTFSIPYTGGNGNYFSGFSLSSIGSVGGLTATLESGNLAQGNGNLTFSISGIPDAIGVAEFPVNFLGFTCIVRKMVVGLGLGVSDIDGNAYGSVLIGSQEWMQQNLKVSKFRNGDLISTNLDSIAWSNDTSGAYAVYDGNSTNDTIYGKLYNWYAVSDARGLCPVGWHVPSRNEWDILNNFLDTAFVPSNNISYSAGGKLKAAGDFQSGTGYWNQPNVGASDEIGFSALGGGQRSENNIYKFKNEIGQWWSSTPFPSLNPPLPWFVEMSKDNRFVANDVANATFGFSVRCLKD